MAAIACGSRQVLMAEYREAQNKVLSAGIDLV